MTTTINTAISNAQTQFTNLGKKGETLRLERSRCLTFESKSYSKDLTTFTGVIKGRDGTYKPKVLVGKGWTCDCTDHQNLLDGTRKKGRNTGDNYAVSPCKHILALARFGWVAMRDLKAQVEKINSIQDNLG
jgi:hypothetical protein